MQEVEVVDVKLVGIKPLLMHAVPASLGVKGRKKEIPSPQDEAEAGLHKDKEGHIIMPALNLLGCLRKAAGDFKLSGRKTYRDYMFSGLEVRPDEIPLLDGLDGSRATTWEVDIRPAVIQRARILRARPRFDSWSLQFQIAITDPMIRASVLGDILKAAGQYVGLCDYRPLFGRFKVEQFEVVKGS